MRSSKHCCNHVAAMFAQNMFGQTPLASEFAVTSPISSPKRLFLNLAQRTI
ncbi:hypothetical protein RRSWK_00088 [Rhodopirellula sp. SWK7]|nr:hypothetical protein RRSWK_00088 [Rhodopirellula sp. SWK7]